MAQTEVTERSIRSIYPLLERRWNTTGTDGNGPLRKALNAQNRTAVGWSGAAASHAVFNQQDMIRSFQDSVLNHASQF